MDNGFDHIKNVLAEAGRITRKAAGVTDREMLDRIFEKLISLEAKVDSIIAYIDRLDYKK